MIFHIQDKYTHYTGLSISTSTNISADLCNQQRIMFHKPMVKRKRKPCYSRNCLPLSLSLYETVYDSRMNYGDIAIYFKKEALSRPTRRHHSPSPNEPNIEVMR
ncbi:unnamed protein product [Rhizophagus irregularis]|nr:unnamed protein product [Rhizophagus irregularis]